MENQEAQSPDTPDRRKRLGKVLISLDLGSDSTVAFARTADGRSIQIDLQHFAPAFASNPLLLTGGARMRLRSRYALNENFQWPYPLAPTKNPEFGYTEWLPKEHCTQPLVEFDPYEDALSHRDGADLSSYGRTRNCLVRFFEDRSSPFSLGSLLPNAKLVFQSALGSKREATVLVEGRRERIVLEPAELIKSQVCLVLENFVRNHPDLHIDGRPPEWKDCTVVLTVPNTYSPIHRDLLAQMVENTLGCSVYTITESDAVVFFYLVKGRPNVGLEQELTEWRHQYLTIDIGRGTTDLTLMDASYEIPAEHWRKQYGISDANPKPRKHFFVCARTGRASGGAKMTFVIAEFLEQLIDHAVQKLAPTVGRSPFRFTSPTDDPDVTPDNDQVLALQAFESICERYKRNLDVVEDKVQLVDIGGGPDDDVDKVSAYVANQVAYKLSKSHFLGGAASDDEAQVRQAVELVLRSPQRLRGDGTALEGPWHALNRAVMEYVKQNVDDVLLELARAHHSDNSIGKPEDVIDALKGMLEEEHPRYRDGSNVKSVRTHVIVAGQASQFRPLRRRLNEIFRQAGLDDIHRLSDGDFVQQQETEPARAKGGLFAKLLPKRVKGARRGREDGGCRQHRVVELDPNDLKDGCALGALEWLVDDPIMENADYIHGQIVTDSVDGGDFQVVKMDALNEVARNGSMRVECRTTGSHIVYYLAARLSEDASPHGLRGDELGRLYTDQDIEIQVRPKDEPQAQLRINGFRNGLRETVHWKDTTYGASEAKHLRPLLWPSVLVGPDA